MTVQRRFYIVRLRKDESIVTVGTTEECAERMGMTSNCFRYTVFRCRHGLNQKYEIDVELEDEEQC